MYPVAQIAVEKAAYAYDKLYSYLLPGELGDAVRPGCRVSVPFGGGNRRCTGLVLELSVAESADRLKPVTALLDEQPLLDDEGLMLLRYLKEHTFCTWFDALRLLIPAGVGVVYKTLYTLGPMQPGEGLSPLQAEMIAFLRARRNGAEERAFCGHFDLEPRHPELLALFEAGIFARREQTGQRIGDERVTMVRLSEDFSPARLTAKQKLVAAFLEENETAALSEILYYTGVGRTVVDNLRKRGQVDFYDAVRFRSPFEEEVLAVDEALELSPAQQAAADEISASMREAHPKPILLHGVTGSGKTAVYLQLIAETLARGRGALVLVPEISLTPQAVHSFRRRFGEEVAVLHSALSLGERMDEWRRIKAGEASIVVGTRSAVFAPLRKIGLIVIDEEQEHTYKSDKTPRFHARDIALRRSRWHNAALLLTSATPSIESYYRAKKGLYRLVTLPDRFGPARLPEVLCVDMREASNLSSSPVFSLPLLEALREGLARSEQSILLLNRRGYATALQCSACGTATECPYCSVAMTYHTANDSLVCHYCGFLCRRPESCEHCGSALIRFGGTGTQKLEQELASLLPGARILRVDTDTTMAKYAHEKYFSAFAAHEYDIMVGTQMVAKGLNFPEVTLVGVLNADQSLYAVDFRSFERSFALLTQVVGRCGRAEKPGRALIQTYSPEHPVIQLAAAQDYEGFYAAEIGSRRLHLYPPFCVIAGIGFVGEDLEQVRAQADRFLEEFRRIAAAEHPGLPIRLLGPAPSEVLKVAGRYRYKLLLKCRSDSETRALLDRMLLWSLNSCKTVSVTIDMHYDRM